MRIQVSTTVGAMILVAEAALALAMIWSVDADTRIQTTATGAEQVIRAIRAYCMDQDECPRNLQQLRPRYLARVPEPGFDHGRWVYQRIERVPTNRRPLAYLKLDIAASFEEPNDLDRADSFELHIGGIGLPDIGLFRDSTRGCWRFRFGTRCWNP